MQVATVHSLPVECVSSILSFLPLKDLLLHASRVCKPWHQALQHPMCFTDITIACQDVLVALRALEHSFPAMFGPQSCITSVHLTQTHQRKRYYDDPPEMVQAASSVPHDLQPPFVELPDVVTLDLCEATPGIAALFLRNASRMPNVGSVSLPGDVHTPELQYLATWSNLASLTIGERFELTEEDMRAIGSISSLRHLVFRNFAGDQDERSFCIGDFLLERCFPFAVVCNLPTRIESLAFEKCEGLVEGSLESLHLLSSLTSLSFIDCILLDEWHLPSSLSRCTSLTSLTLDKWHSGFEWPYLMEEEAEVIASIPHLARATLPGPLSQEVVRMISRCPKLVDLHFVHVPSWGAEWLSLLPPALLESHLKHEAAQPTHD